ncbi:MAG: ArsR family transcriptional regulator [Euryarchaeota archaeon RBG_13_31_8]|nr:MAG: ArsR family transcriptional regulator [Euryarchaeota archaeon RBG_13_31_8]
MVKRQYYRLNPQDEKIVKVFSDLGMPRNLAKTLMYISQTEECRSAEIEHGANLRQPEVSVAMQVLQNKGWIAKRDLRKKGKGRPVHLYKLTSPINDIIKNFEKEKLKQIDNIKDDLEELKTLIDGR